MKEPPKSQHPQPATPTVTPKKTAPKLPKSAGPAPATSLWAEGEDEEDFPDDEDDEEQDDKDEDEKKVKVEQPTAHTVAVENQAEPAPAAKNASKPTKRVGEESPKAASLRRWMQRSNAVYSMHEAVLAGDMAVLKARMAEAVDIERKDELGRTPLFIAAENNRQDMASLLLEKGADITACDAQGRCITSFYEGKKRPPAVEKAFRNIERCRNAVAAIESGDDKKLKACLREGLNPNSQSESQYLLQYALEKGNAVLVADLLDAGASTDIRYRDGKTPLHVAAGRGQLEIAVLLLENGADCMAQAGNGAYPLHEAVWHNRFNLVDLLLPRYQKYNFTPPNGGSGGQPVAMAIRRRSNKSLELFLQHGLKVNASCFAENPLLICAVRSKNADAVRMLLKAGADKNARDKDGRSAMDYADDAMKDLLK